MNKADLIERVAAEHELTRGFARELVESVFQAIVEAAQNGEEVSLFGFGKFKVADRAARKGRNPRTGEAVKIAPKKVLKFEAAKAMKESLNAKKRARRKAA